MLSEKVIFRIRVCFRRWLFNVPQPYLFRSLQVHLQQKICLPLLHTILQEYHGPWSARVLEVRPLSDTARLLSQIQRCCARRGVVETPSESRPFAKWWITWLLITFCYEWQCIVRQHKSAKWNKSRLWENIVERRVISSVWLGTEAEKNRWAPVLLDLRIPPVGMNGSIEFGSQDFLNFLLLNEWAKFHVRFGWVWVILLSTNHCGSSKQYDTLWRLTRPNSVDIGREIIPFWYSTASHNMKLRHQRLYNS